jgi:hypothetical protein
MCMHSQLGDGSREPLFNDISGTLQTTVRDHTASTATRAAVCSKVSSRTFLALLFIVSCAGQAVEALSFTCFISCRDDDKVVHNMGLLEHEMDAHIADLCVAALGGWSLMITQLAPRRAAASFERMAEVLDKLMGAPDVDVRIGASEALAVMVEQCRAADEAFDDGARDALDGLVEQLALLSTDSDRRRCVRGNGHGYDIVNGMLTYILFDRL